MKPVDGYADTMFTDRAVDFINRKKDAPFFLYLPYTAPHSRIEAREEDIAEHKGKFEENEKDKPFNATYAALVTRMDKEIGRVTKALADAGLDGNTIVVFTSDHGATFETLQRGTAVYHDSNRPFRGQKRTLWEGGARVPTFVRWPGGNVPAGVESREVMSMIDLFPTFLAATDTQAPSDVKLDGQSVLDVIRGKAKVPQRTI